MQCNVMFEDDGAKRTCLTSSSVFSDRCLRLTAVRQETQLTYRNSLRIPLDSGHSALEQNFHVNEATRMSKNQCLRNCKNLFFLSGHRRVPRAASTSQHLTSMMPGIHAIWKFVHAPETCKRRRASPYCFSIPLPLSYKCSTSLNTI